MSARFEIFTGTNQQHYFRYFGKSETQILRSEGYTSRGSCEKGITAVKNNADRSDAYDLQSSKNGLYYFNVKAGNGQIVATSLLFATETDRATAMVDVQTHASSAPIEG